MPTSKTRPRTSWCLEKIVAPTGTPQRARRCRAAQTRPTCSPSTSRARHLVLGRGAKARERCRSRAWHRRTRGAEWPTVKGAPLSGAEDRVVRAHRRPRRRPLPDGAGRNPRSAAADAEVGRGERARTRPERVNAVMIFRRGNSVSAFRTLRYKCPPTRDENGVQGAAHGHGVKCAPS